MIDESGEINTTLLAGYGSKSSNTITPLDNNFIAVISDSSTNCVGVRFDDVSTWDADVSIGILHLGMVYELPTNAVSSLEYNTINFNNVSTAVSGASYSNLQNDKGQRILKASWDNISWSSGSSGISDFTEMLGYCFGSHIPVAIQLSQDNVPASSSGSQTTAKDWFMFARISKWNANQISPTLWKVSAEFTEFI